MLTGVQMKSRILLGLTALSFMTAAGGLLAGPLAQTEREFGRLVAGREAVRERTVGGAGFLWIDQYPELAAAVKRGETVVRTVAPNNPVDVPGGLVHDWIGTVFIPGATLDSTLAFVQDYDNHKRVYHPEVMESRTVTRRGDEYHTYMRLRKQKVITVILDSEHDVKYTRLSDTRAYSRSNSTRISEIDNAGTAEERALSQADDHGFLWRLNSYWRFEERDGGVWVECEAISLTRDVPFGLGGVLKPIIRDLPAESLAKTLEATRKSLAKRSGAETPQVPLASNLTER
jgi:hypothetical protein